MPAKKGLHFVHFSPNSSADARRQQQQQSRTHIAQAYRRRDRLKQVEEYTAQLSQRASGDEGNKDKDRMLALSDRLTTPPNQPQTAHWIDPFDVASLQLPVAEQSLLHYFFTDIGPVLLPDCPQDQAQTWQCFWLREAIESPCLLGAVLSHASIYKDAVNGTTDGGVRSLQLSNHAITLLREEVRSQSGKPASDALLETVCALLTNAVIQGDEVSMRLHMPALQRMLSNRAAAGDPVEKQWLLQVIGWQTAHVSIHLNDVELTFDESELCSEHITEVLLSSEPLFAECRSIKVMHSTLTTNAADYSRLALECSQKRCDLEAKVLALFCKIEDEDEPIVHDKNLSSLIATALLMFTLCELRMFGRASHAMKKLARKLIDAIVILVPLSASFGQALPSTEASQLLLWASAIAARGMVDSERILRLESCIAQLLVRLQYVTSRDVERCCEKFVWSSTLWSDILDGALQTASAVVYFEES